MALCRGHCSALLHLLETIMQITTVLSPAAVVDALKAQAQQASKNFIKNPNAFHWNRQAQTAFVYQQAYYFFWSVTRTAEQKHNLLVALSRDPDGNWGDAICQSALGVSLISALREHANCP
jgi:hypothetical protein